MARRALAFIVLPFAFCVLSSPTDAETIVVDPNGTGDYLTIQEAVDASASGDFITMYPGVYPEDVVIDDKLLHLTSTEGRDVTRVQSFSWQRSGGTLTDLDLLEHSQLEGREDFTVEDCRIASISGSVVGARMEVTRCEIGGIDILADGQSRGVDAYARVTDCTVGAVSLAQWGEDSNGGSASVRGCTVGSSAYVNADGGGSVSNCTFTAYGDILVTSQNDGADATAFGNMMLHGGEISVHGMDATASSNVIVGGVGIRAAGGSIDCEGVSSRASNNTLIDCTEGIIVGSCGDSHAHVSDNLLVRCGAGVKIGTLRVSNWNYSLDVQGNTIVDCDGPALIMGRTDEHRYTLARNLVVGCQSGIHMSPGTAGGSVACNDVWGVTLTNWAGIPDPTGIDGNISEDPRFCDAGADNYELDAESPCLPGNQPAGADCGGIIGALDLGCAVADVDPPFGVSAVLPQVTGWPNPTRGAVTFELADPTPGSRLGIYDSSGRRLRSIDLSDGEKQIYWDGTDELGREVIPGVYFYRIDGVNTAGQYSIVRIG